MTYQEARNTLKNLMDTAKERAEVLTVAVDGTPYRLGLRNSTRGLTCGFRKDDDNCDLLSRAEILSLLARSTTLEIVG